MVNYKCIKETIPLSIKNDSILDISTNGVNKYTHGFHKYPAKFIPHIPAWAIKKYLGDKSSQCILDPFCGSGTTLVEGMLAENNVIGIDVDPLSVMISKVKTTKVNLELLDEISYYIRREINGYNSDKFYPSCPNIKHWFTDEAINKLAIIRALIESIDKKYSINKELYDIKDLFLICFSSIIRRVSNADNQSQKTYVSHTKLKEPEEVNQSFLSQLDYFIDRIKLFSRSVNPSLSSKIINSSSIECIDSIIDDPIEIVITSPPYIKAIDYIYNQMVELFWIGDLFGLETQDKQNLVKYRYVGNKHLRKIVFEEYNPYCLIFGEKKLDHKIQQIYETDKKNGHKHAFIVYDYFIKMKQHFCQIAKILPKGKHYIMVIGDSSVSNIYLNTSDLIVIIAEQSGFRLKNKWGYKIKNRFMRFNRKGRGGLIEIDWVLDFERI